MVVTIWKQNIKYIDVNISYICAYMTPAPKDRNKEVWWVGWWGVICSATKCMKDKK